MANYKVFFKVSVQKDLASIPTKDRERILNRIKRLEGNPRPPSCEKLAGSGAKYRLRQGRYRIVYSVDDTEHVVCIVKVARRKDIYR